MTSVDLGVRAAGDQVVRGWHEARGRAGRQRTIRGHRCRIQLGHCRLPGQLWGFGHAEVLCRLREPCAVVVSGVVSVRDRHCRRNEGLSQSHGYAYCI